MDRHEEGQHQQNVPNLLSSPMGPVGSGRVPVRTLKLAWGRFVLGIVLVVSVSLSIYGAPSEDVETRSNGPSDNSYMYAASYNGSTECGTCHVDTHDSWMRSLHPKKMRVADETTIVGDWDTDPVIPVGDGDVTVSLSSNATGHFVDLDGTGQAVFRVEHVLGGGEWKQQYVTTIGQSRYILPIQWNVETGEWVGYDVTEWYDGATGEAKAVATDMSWDRRCAGCHATGVEVDYDDGTGEWIASYAELGIGCEACHGPGSLHIDPPTGQTRINTIWSTVDSAICGNCHNRGQSVGQLGGMTLGYPYSAGGDIIKPGDDHDRFFTPQGNYHPDGETSANHRQQYPDYIGHNHSMALDTILSSDLKAERCLKCHSTDYRLAPEDEKPSLSTAEFSIECVACHDPHGPTYEHMLRLPQEEVCTQCHQTFETEPGEVVHHPQAEMLAGTISIQEITGEPWMGGIYICTDCHMPKVATNAVDYDIASHRFYFISPDVGIQYDQPSSCTVSCHGPGQPGDPMTDEQVKSLIDGWKVQTTSLLAIANADLRAAKAVLDAAEGVGFTFGVFNASNQSYNKALLARDYVTEDGTMVHNHVFALQLLDYAIAISDEIVTALTPGTLKGTVHDGEGKAVSGATIREGDVVWATTGADGAFEFQVAPGERTFEVYEGDVKRNVFTAEAPTGGAVNDLGKVSFGKEDEGFDLTLFLVIAIVTAAIAVVLALLPRGRSK